MVNSPLQIRGAKMADDQVNDKDGPAEDQKGSAESHPHRRAILQALGAAPVILTLTSRLAHGYEQSASQDPCYVPRNPNTPPPDPDQCDKPPPGT